ncbi:hypothetical protein H4S02_006243 [Coemansia sp. RSA 2611]|nr:hypothetical protein H4S02_006243 [Coemansia sp. RSA 2611]
MSQAARFGKVFIAKAANASARTAAFPTFRRAGVRMTALSSPINLASVRGMHSSPQLRTAASDTVQQTSTVGDIAASATQSVDPGAVASVGMQVGDLASHGLETMLPVRLTEYVLEFVHVSMGLPWWATIGAVVLGYRLLILPVNAWSQKHMMKTMQVQPEMNRITEHIKTANMKHDYMSSAKYSQELLALRKRADVSLFKPMVGNALQLPFMLMMFGALRDLATIPAAHMDTGGTLWFTNLMAADPYMILPALSAIGTIGSFELQNKLNASVEQSREMKIALRFVAVLGAAITSGFSSSVLLFWVYNTGFTLLQLVLFNAKWFRNLMKIPGVKKVKFVRPPENFLDKMQISKFIGGKSKSGQPSAPQYKEIKRRS